MARYAYDVETNGFLPKVDTIHCLVLVDLDTDEVLRFRGDDIATGLATLQAADLRVGHNVVSYDDRVIAHVTGTVLDPDRVVDTLLVSRSFFSDIKQRDFSNSWKPHKVPPNLRGRHSLESWGARLGFPKDDYSARMKAQGLDPWAVWNQDMEDYCVVDVQLTVALYRLFVQRGALGDTIPPWLTLEQQVRRLIDQQETNGFGFDHDAAVKLMLELRQRHDELEATLRSLFQGWWAEDSVLIPKRDDRRHGYTAGAPVTKIKWVDFNPASTQHIAKVLISQGWVPKEDDRTETGLPQVTEATLTGLDIPGVPEILEYLMVTKRLGQLCDGKEAWLRAYNPDTGSIHGRVDTLGAVTARMTHSKPNIAQVPKVGTPYGAECRSLFVARKGWRLVGCDAEGLELRCLAHYMARYDGGAYGQSVVHGSKDDGTDVHTLTQKAIGLRSRNSAKTWVYAFLYGAGDMKLGSIVWSDMDPATRGPKDEQRFLRMGRQSRARIAKNLPALGRLVEDVKTAAKAKGWLRGIDGRCVRVRGLHSALNTLLQSAGAIVMKQALVEFWSMVDAAGLADDVRLVANVHDEFQMEVRGVEGLPERVGELAARAIAAAGERLGFRCPLAGAWGVGVNWAETH